jgi:hypothetical protein
LRNSRNPVARYFKAPIKENNESFWLPFIEGIFFIFHIKVTSTLLAINSRRKTPFIGFLTLITSISGIYKNYVKAGPLK